MSGRHYGYDETDDFDTLAEATTLEDGTIHIETVVVDKRDNTEQPAPTPESQPDHGTGECPYCPVDCHAPGGCLAEPQP